MDEEHPLDTLIEMKARLGPLAFIKFENTDLRSVHHQLGEMMRPQIQKILSDRLARLSTAQRAQELAAARQIHTALLDRIASPAIERKVKEAIEGSAFLYPDLLPGPTFGWRSDRYIQAMDSLPLKPHPQVGAILANIATWVTFHLGGEVDPRETIEMLAPFWDGYAITCAREEHGRVTAQKIEFARETLKAEVLGEQPGKVAE